MKYYIIAGEASGDLHASNLMKAILKQDSNADFRFWGGDLMARVGGTLVKHYRDLAFMGFWEVFININTILKNIKFCKKDILNYTPDAIIFIDYPGFNMRIAKWAKKRGFATHYYISPQIWAWKENRIKAIKRDIDAMYVILPFEEAFYKEKHQFLVHFVGHPLLDAIKDLEFSSFEKFIKKHKLSNKPIIALLPGSRKQEIAKMLSIMCSVVDEFSDYQFVIAGAPSVDYDFYRPFLKENKVAFVSSITYELLSHSQAALVASGTATLETALLNVPEIVCYKGNWISYKIAKSIIKLKFISLVNLIMDAEIIKELIQNDLNKINLVVELKRILQPDIRQDLLDKYQLLRQRLGNNRASERTAQYIIKSMKNKKNE